VEGPEAGRSMPMVNEFVRSFVRPRCESRPSA